MIFKYNYIIYKDILRYKNQTILLYITNFAETLASAIVVCAQYRFPRPEGRGSLFLASRIHHVKRG